MRISGLNVPLHVVEQFGIAHLFKLAGVPRFDRRFHLQLCPIDGGEASDAGEPHRGVEPNLAGLVPTVTQFDGRHDRGERLMSNDGLNGGAKQGAACFVILIGKAHPFVPTLPLVKRPVRNASRA